MIQKLFNNPHVLYQSASEERGISESAICAHLDAGGLIILSQEGRDILVDQSSVNELCRLLKKLATA